MPTGDPPATSNGTVRAGLECVPLPEIPGWQAFRSRPDRPGRPRRFWASRTGPNRQHPSFVPAWWAMTVDGDTAADLCAAIQEQELRAASG